MPRCRAGRSSAKRMRASGDRAPTNSVSARFCPLPSVSGNGIETSPRPRKTTGRHDDTEPAGRTDAVGPGDRPDEPDRPEADDRRHHQSPDINPPGQVGRGNRVDRGVGDDRHGKSGCDGRGDERRQDQPQRQPPAQDLKGEQRGRAARCRRRPFPPLSRSPPGNGAVRRRALASSTSRLPKTAPVCFGAPSRPSAAPMPTMTIEMTALPRVRRVGIRPAWNQIAAVMSIPLPLESQGQQPLPCSRQYPGAEQEQNVPRRARAPRRLCQLRRVMSTPASPCTSFRSAVRSAKPFPAATPVRTTANQNRGAPGSLIKRGTSAPALSTADPQTPYPIA